MKIVNWNDVSKTKKHQVLSRPQFTHSEFLINKTNDIVNQVKNEGDQALLALTAEFDQVKLNTLSVSPEEFIQADNIVDKETKKAIEFAKQQIENYQKQIFPIHKTIKTTSGVYCERQARAIERIGLYPLHFKMRTQANAKFESCL
jgi:histidinol dehydrogenase